MPDILPISLFDSYKKTDFTINPDETVVPKTLKLYSCGPTVYSTQHIGNMRAAWFGDTLAKAARLAGWKVEWVLNITDVGHLVSDGDEGEDKIEKGAKKEGKSAEEVVNFYLEDYVWQTKQIGLDIPLGLMRPKATEYIKEQMILALELLQQKRAYLLEDGIYYDSEANKEVLFEVEKEPGMPKTDGDNRFTGRNIENTQKNPADFALWKFVDENSLQKWRFADFPEAIVIMNEINQRNTKDSILFTNFWGCPGWHSECVTMISEILGQKRFSQQKFSFVNSDQTFEIDVHTGGIEHIPVHHKNEILQSEAFGFHLAKHWVHFEHLLIDGGKMSKSQGNNYTIHDIIKKGFDPLAFKLMLFEHNYQDQMNFTWEKLEQSQATLINLRKEIAKLMSFKTTEGFLGQSDGLKFNKYGNIDNVKVPIVTALTDNLDTSKALVYLNMITNYLSNDIKKIGDFSRTQFEDLVELDRTFFGLQLFSSIPDEIIEIGTQHWQARLQKNWALADELRTKSTELGWPIDDYAWGWGAWWNPTLTKKV